MPTPPPPTPVFTTANASPATRSGRETIWPISPPTEELDGDASRAYTRAVRSGDIEPDTHQIAVVRHLDRLITQLRESPRRRRFFSWRQRDGTTERNFVRGIYLHGNVGTGKTFLMDLFFRACKVSGKRRQHALPFLLDMQSELHRRQRLARTEGAAYEDDTIALGLDLARRHRLLCLDEFTVRHIAHATVLSRLMGAYFSGGGTLVTTSNVAPSQLYAGGFNRDLFLPFIALLSRHCTPVEIGSRRDFRLRAGNRERTRWFSPLTDASRAAFARAWSDATDGKAAHRARHVFLGRTMDFGEAVATRLRARFADICDQPLGSADLRVLVSTYRALYLSDIPSIASMKPDQRERFVALIDLVYDNDLAFVGLADSDPLSLGSGFESDVAIERLLSRLVALASPAPVHDDSG